MPTISGSVLFNTNNATPTTGVAIANIPVVLQNTTTGVGLVVLTNAAGAYSFTNVPAGDYRIVEAYGTTGGVPTPADFTTAAVIPDPTPNDPAVSAITTVPAGTNNIQSLTPNTLNVTVAAANITAQNFIDGPTKDVAIKTSCITVSSTNLLTDISNGTWGGNPNGTPINTHPATAPYPSNVPGFTYITTGAADGSYTINNTRTLAGSGGPAVWWNTSDHTSGDETGRFQMVGGSSPGAIVFTTTIPVKANTNYMVSTWIMNLINTSGFAAPKLGVKVLDSSQNVIYNQSLTNIPVDNIPTWYQVGTVFNSFNSNTVTLQVISLGPSAAGNDFATDDFAVQEAIPDPLLSVTKYVDKTVAEVGNVLTYTVNITNKGLCTAQNIIFQDTIPLGTSFVANSVKVDNVVSSANPESPGISISNINPGKSATIQFKVTVNTVPTINPIPNDSTINYAFAAVAAGTIPTGTVSNTVETKIVENKVVLQKIADKTYATCGDIIKYTFVASNFGTTTPVNIILKDTIPNGVSFITNSVFVNGVSDIGSSPLTGINVGTLPIGSSSTVTFSVRVLC